jgi:hypothetical protein
MSLNTCAKATEAHARELLSTFEYLDLLLYCSLVCSLIRSWAAYVSQTHFEGFLGMWSQSQFRRSLTCDLQVQTAVLNSSIDENRTHDSINNPCRALALRDSSQSRHFHYVQPSKIHNTARQRSKSHIPLYSRSPPIPHQHSLHWISQSCDIDCRSACLTTCVEFDWSIRLQGLVSRINFGAKVGSRCTSSRKVACKDRLDEGAEDNLGTTENHIST